MRLEGKVAIVTGAAGAGIGQGVARVLAREGANVVVSDAHPKRPFEIAEDISKSTGRPMLGNHCDVSNREQVESMVKETLDKFGRIDILVNNAGGNRLCQFVEMTDEIWDFVLNVNLRGTYYCSRFALPTMLKQKFGRIVNISSSIVFMASADGEVPYTVAKSGIVGLTRSLAREVSAQGVTVNCIAPGLIMNPFLKKIYPEEVLDKLLPQIPMGRTGAPEEIGGAVLFLVSDDGSYMTGQTLSVSGGWSLW